MKTRKIRLLSALLALAMLLALLPTAAFADTVYGTVSGVPSGDCGAEGNEENVHWTLDSDGTMTISGSGAMGSYSYDRGNNTTTTPWDSKRKEITKVVIEGDVTSIGDNAFSGCANLESVDLSGASSLTAIGTSFFDCTKLDDVELNEGLVTIGGSAFSVCTSLKSIHIPSTVMAIGGWCFQECYGLEEVTFANNSQLTTIEGAAFIDCYGLKKITIPKRVKEIQEDAVQGNRYGAFESSGLESVIFEPGSQLETVAQFAFFGCNNLTIYRSDEDTNVNAALNEKSGIGEIKSLTPTVTFDVDGNVAVFEKQNVKDNNFKAVKPENPTKKGYVFTDWYTKDADGKWAEKPFNFDTLITDNMTLYARWATALVPITPAVELYPIAVDCGTAYDAEGNPIEKAAAGDVVTIKADETALDGMTFERWEVRKGNVKLENDRAAKTSFTMPAGEVQLEAMYQAADANDSGWDAATVVTGAVIGTGTAILAYHIGMEVYAEQVLGKDVAVPRTRGEVALLAWQLAGSPAVNGEGEPLSEAAQAEKWAVESGLMEPDAEGNFNGAKKMSKLKALRTLEKAKHA